MQAERKRLDDIFLVGKRTELSGSLRQNNAISMKFWQYFNQELHKNQLKQGAHFEKYAITIREGDKLTYACGVPSNQSYPDDFEIFRIPKGDYLCFQHVGPMHAIPITLRTIFDQEINNQNIERKAGNLIYFEKYDERFAFNDPSSIIEIYVPLKRQEKRGIEEIPAKSILSGRGTSIGEYSWFGMDFNMNLYKGCSHGCIYCDSRSRCYQVTEFDRVRVKKDELLILEQQLKGKRHKGVIGIGAMSDTYNPLEKTLKITRGALQLIDRYGFGVGIDTKSTLILRDIDLLTKISSQYPSIIKLTITTYDDELSKIIEPHVPVSSERFQALEELHKAGIYAGILLMPILPYINDTKENIIKLVEMAHIHHAKFIYPAFGMSLRDNQRDYYYYQLDRLYPGKRALYEARYHKTYSCDSPHAAKLYKLFTQECRKYGIRYRMNDIINGYKKPLLNQAQLIL